MNRADLLDRAVRTDLQRAQHLPQWHGGAWLQRCDDRESATRCRSRACGPRRGDARAHARVAPATERSARSDVACTTPRPPRRGGPTREWRRKPDGSITKRFPSILRSARRPDPRGPGFYRRRPHQQRTGVHCKTRATRCRGTGRIETPTSSSGSGRTRGRAMNGLAPICRRARQCI
jgi:hypothetical protein